MRGGGGGGFSRRGPPADKASSAQIDSYVHALYPPSRQYHAYRSAQAMKLPPISADAACQRVPISAAELLAALGPGATEAAKGDSEAVSRKRMRCPMADSAVAPLITPAAWNVMTARLPQELRVFVHPSAGPDAHRETLQKLISSIKSARRPKREKPIRRGSLVTFSGKPVAVGSFSKPSVGRRQKVVEPAKQGQGDEDEIPLDAPNDAEDSVSSLDNDDDDDMADGGDSGSSGGDYDLADDNF